MGYDLKRYTPAWFGDYMKKFGHLLTITHDKDGHVDKFYFMDYELELDICSPDNMFLKTIALMDDTHVVKFQPRLFFLTFCLDDKPGVFFMNKDLNLPVDICVLLYENNINISYYNGRESVDYDRQAIM